ncbi:MAG: V-type ATP synthase subunit E, partial [Spirochaetaceae bacterium]|nr:V-type ATP synthase subunit E [Spirochaetaceae bacterium]
IEQAGRNLVLSFRDSVCAQLAAVVAAKTEKAYSPEALAALVPATVKAWAKNPEAESLAVLLSPKDLDALEGAFKSSLGAELSRGLELKADPSLASGFRIGSKDGSAYYDYSAESVAALFSSYLNPRVSAIMKDAAGVLKG